MTRQHLTLLAEAVGTIALGVFMTYVVLGFANLL